MIAETVRVTSNARPKLSELHSRRGRAHDSRREANHIEAATQVHLDDAHEGVEGVRSVLAEHLFREDDTGGIDDPAEHPQL